MSTVTITVEIEADEFEDADGYPDVGRIANVITDTLGRAGFIIMGDVEVESP